MDVRFPAQRSHTSLMCPTPSFPTVSPLKSLFKTDIMMTLSIKGKYSFNSALQPLIARNFRGIPVTLEHQPVFKNIDLQMLKPIII